MPTQTALTFTYLPIINFALQQNHVPVLRELTLTNTSDEDWQKITVEIVSEPDFSLPWKHSIESLKKEEVQSFRQLPLQVSSKYLAELTERITGNFRVSVTANNKIVHQEYHKVDLLPYEQWSGIGLMPEILAAFITPNHPEILNIVRKASVILGKWTGNPSFDEYQSRDPNRVRKQMAAIYETIAQMQLVYCSVPASFEERGQRIRLADNIFSNKLANCLDLSLLFAACLEAVGIHPLIVVVKGHAFAGAWLIHESFADHVNDDPSLITKRTADGISEIAVVEATCMNAGHQIPFDDAVRAADQKMTQTEEFVLFLDVKRARFSNIRPLPLRMATNAGWEIKEEPKPTERANVLPQDIAVGNQLVYASKIEVTKQRLWERKLLDLTLRNSLLNVRITKSVIQFMTLNAVQLEDALANGEEFQVLARPADWDNGMRDKGLYQALHQSDPLAELVKHELSHRRIRSYLPESELQSALTNVYRSSRLALEENGANTLYIGLGMLKWYETEASERARYAPILLIPVEIIRKSAQKGYVIRSREEETILNITLMEMLRQDFGISIGGLDTLPRDESGVDVKRILNVLRQAVMTKSRWDVEEQVILGTFSFSKFILWNDIHHNADQLCKNKVVASLMSGKLEWETTANDTTAEIQDEQLHPAHIALPISTDSSQLHAVVSSGQDKSFVLHGPPGTGKSQTITNIIASALYAGKRVLFVAAKKAALDVVQSRLESIGIGPFCLELHSNKSKKSAVLEQLKATTQVAYKNAPESFKQEADRLFTLKKELNVYVNALHKKHRFGYSLYDLFTEYSQLPKGPDTVVFPSASIENLTTPELTAWTDLAEEMQTIGQLIGNPQEHPLRGIQLDHYNTQIKQDAKHLIEQYLPLLTKAEHQTIIVRNILKLDGFDISIEQHEVITTLTGMLGEFPDLPASLLQTDNLEQTLAQVIGIASHGKQRDLLRVELLEQYQKDILTFPAAQTLAAWNIAKSKWFLPRWLKQNTLLKNIQPLSLIGKLQKQDVPGLLQTIIHLQEEQEHIDKAPWLSPLLGFLWKNGDADWEAVARYCASVIEINQTVHSLIGTAHLKQWRNLMAAEWAEGSRAYTSYHAKALQEYLAIHEQLRIIAARLQQLLGVNLASFRDNQQKKRSEMDAVTQWLQHLDGLKDWYNWTDIKTRAVQAGLQPLVTSYENGSVASEKIVQQFRKGFCRSAAEHIIQQTPQLSTFNSRLFDDKIRKFRAISKQFETLTRQELYARLAAKVPNFTQEASQSSEIGLLQRAIRNNGRAMSIRKIFDSIPNLLPRLTPCMLMSPISVAQYFDADSAKFDLVVFDEASQMPTCEAVGAIARGNNLIVVGDPKQMPPTSFFSNNNIDEDNIDKEDLESILDDCLALSMPSQHLLWHYRSKHESLITFSNAKYYDNKLLTFPSTDDIDSKVRFVPVEGFYDKGKTRQNQAEAKAIVEEVVHRLSNPALAKRSIGIVTFSSAQQILIDDMLTEIFAAHPDLENTALETGEPLFIKNLENVQGDERDVILFSVGYGPDKEGKVSLNFGPINREGGWRRLNVAVSRARYEMKVFSTLHADEIDLNRTASEGVAGLKAFLAYAEKGKAVLPTKTTPKHTGGSSLEDAIAQDIRARGYEVHTHIGSSAYKIDIGIVDRKHPSKYLLAILTDGKNYGNAVTSKDREIVQPNVLDMLGWNTYKIWYTEWWENPDKVINGILEAIRKAEETSSGTLRSQVEADNIEITTEEESREPVLNSLNSPHPEPIAVKSALTTSAVPYEVCHLQYVIATSADDFLMPSNQHKIIEQISAVLEKEAPVSKDLLCKRVLAAWGISRIGSRINNHFELLFLQMGLKPINYGKSEFFWKQDQQPDQYQIYRVVQTDAAKRDADDLPPEEVANGVREILKNQISLSQTDLVKETARLFGYARAGTNVENAMLLGINKAIADGYAIRKNDRVIHR